MTDSKNVEIALAAHTFDDLNGSIEDLATRLSNDIYELAVQFYESAERGGLIYGNGHHAAQNLAAYAKGDLLSRKK